MATRYIAPRADAHGATPAGGRRERSNRPAEGAKSGGTTRDALRRLTPRQRDVLDLMTQGKSNKDIGRALNLTGPAVKRDAAAILRTLEVTSRTKAVLKALRASALPASAGIAPLTYLGYIPAAILSCR
jgi:DNA-binding NarL/FixJ family response regulator